MNSIDAHSDFGDLSSSCAVTPHGPADNAVPKQTSLAFDMDLFRQELLETVIQEDDERQMLMAVSRLIGERLGCEGMVYFSRDRSDTLVPQPITESDAKSQELSGNTELATLAETACRDGRLIQGHSKSEPRQTVVCLPLQFPAGSLQALLIIFSGACGSGDPRLSALELVASYVTLWHVHRTAVSAEREAELTAALQELLEAAESCDDMQQACQVLADRLREYLGCERVALATCSPWSKRRVVRAISGINKFDEHAPLVEAMEAALDESVLRDTLTIWPPDSETGRYAALAHHKLCNVADVACVVSSPLRTGRGELIGAWLFLGSRQSLARAPLIRLLRASENRVASCLSLLAKVHRGLLSSCASRVAGKRSSWRTRGVLLGICLLVAVLFLPVHYRIGCDCRIEPVTRRYVAAPYDGILKTALVTSGATVEAGDVLAVMDGREIRWELAGIVAERDRAAKQSEAAFAQHEFAAANVGRLEADRLELKKELFENRQQNLEIKSPIAGIVVFGDLEKAEGAPVTCGETLFEIAPLAEMVVELSVPEREIPYVSEGQPVSIRLEACRKSPLQAKIERIHPRSQIRDQQNVFLAEVTLTNETGELRPGMQGSARIHGPSRTLGWIVFHKPWETVCWWLGW